MYWLILPAVLVLLILILLIRTFSFKPKEASAPDETAVEFDRDKAVSNLQTLIRFKTVSNHDHALEDDAQFEGLIAKLPELYPNVFRVCTLERFPDRGLLFHWKGKGEGAPAVLMAHYDVVPVNEEAWDKPPFEAIIEDGVLWGRGSLDTKVTFNGVLTAADHLIGKGFVPENDLYFAFSGGEEVNGKGAVHIVEHFAANGITPAFVLDEGGAVVEGVFPGVKERCGLIGIAEKGMVGIDLCARSAGGHASAPKPGAPVDRLARACTRILDNPMPVHITAPAAKMFDTLGRRSNFVYRLIFANLWLFKPVLAAICRKSGGEMNALMRTTTAFTMMDGSKASNVIPPEAHMTINIRINPAVSIRGVVGHLNKVIADPNVSVSVIEGNEPSPISVTDCEGWEKVSSAVVSTWKGCIVAPYLMVQCSDSRHYGSISDRVFRFSAMDLTAEERGTIHGNNERIRLETLLSAVEFYIRLISAC